MSLRRTRLPGVVLLAIGLVCAPRAASQTLPPDFALQPIGDGWFNPVGIAFLDASHQLVAEKVGRLWSVVDGVRSSLVLDLRTEVVNNGDRGLLDVAVGPRYALDHHIYLLLDVDPNQDATDNDKETFARLVRYTTVTDPEGNVAVDSSSRVVLLGATWTEGMPACHMSHTVGTMHFLSDGSLVLGAGDGAHFEKVDDGGLDPGCFGDDRLSWDQDLGAFRAQYMSTLAGKILRVDPETGLGLPDNPYFDGNPASSVSRIWAMGLRNPFHFSLEPGSGPREALYLADVGWETWEEIDVVRGGENFGWPCNEGPEPQRDYRSVDSSGWCAGAIFASPMLAWHHFDPGPIGFTGTCASGVARYAGTVYPPLYQGALFFCDYTGGWMRIALLDGGDRVVSILPFASGLANPLKITTDPVTGDLVFFTLGTSAIQRLRYVGTSGPPIAAVDAQPRVGRAPLAVQLSASSSYDPDGGQLSFHWELGDGATADVADPLHVYQEEGVFTASVTITDTQSESTVAQVAISTENTPPAITAITAPLDGSFFENGIPVALSASATDVEDDRDHLPLSANWHVDLVHDHHTHPDWVTIDGLAGSYVPESHGEGTYHRITLVVTDSEGATDSRTIAVYDVDTTPRAHLVSLSDYSPRSGERITATGHMEYPGKGPGDLIWDWGDGTVDTFRGYSHQQDSLPQHRYLASGSYDVKLTAVAGADEDTAVLGITVRPDQPAIAVFVPLVVERAIPWQEQEAIASAITATASSLGFDASVFYYNDQAALAQWMHALMGDAVRDVLVVLDVCPAAVFDEEPDASLAERWVQAGDGIVWTGAGPFEEILFADGSTAPIGPTGADQVLDAALPGLCLGAGPQNLLPLAARDVPSLPAFASDHALRLEALGAGWVKDRLYAVDLDRASDAVVIANRSGGFYAQFFCSDAPGLPRADVLLEFLKTYLLFPGTHVPAPPSPPSLGALRGG